MSAAAEEVFIALGSNLGDRRANLERAVELMGKLPVSEVLAVSPFYETPPEGGAKQPPYLNGVARLRSALIPEMLLNLTQAIEKQMGRHGKGDGAPRPIDLDILLFGRRRIELPRLTVPHPRLASRWFVLKPLSDLNAALVVPGAEVTVAELLKDLEGRGN